MSSSYLALLTSKSRVCSGTVINKTGFLPEIKVEMIAQSQSLDSFFSDLLHIVISTNGRKSTSKCYDSRGQKTVSNVIVSLTGEQVTSFLKWLSEFKTDKNFVSYTGSDTKNVKVKVDSTRTFVLSQLENDLKFRFGIHEFYLGKMIMNVQFCFSETSHDDVKGRETLLRMLGLPIRVIKRLVDVKKDESTK